MSGYCEIADVCSSFPQFQRSATGSISDAQIQGWIDDRKVRIRSMLLARGYDPDNPPTPLTDDQSAFLRALNRDGAISDLGDALQGTVTLQPGEYSLAQAHRKTYENVLREISKGVHDSLFQPAISRKADVKPLFGGIGGAETEKGFVDTSSNRAFQIGKVF